MVKAFKRMLIAGEIIQSLDQLDQQINLTEIMTPNPVTLAPSDPVGKAIELFAQKKFQALPVVEHGKVVGIVSIKDVVEFFHLRG
jgi:CBS domain-containing protein